jgi:hypothetical protein
MLLSGRRPQLLGAFVRWYHESMLSVPRSCVLASIPALFAVVGMPTLARAAPAWIDRAITLPRHDWAFDFGLGVGHSRAGDTTGLGMNIEGAVGVTQHLEIGLRTGVRFGNDGRATHADEYGRLFDRQTFGTNWDTMANPEFRLRGGVVEGEVAEVALEGRVVLPFEDGSRVGMMFGIPLAFHFGGPVRLDTGVYLPVVFHDPVLYAVSVPVDVWIQATRQLWLGPMTGVHFYHQGGNEHTDVALGFGLGYSISRALDLKTMFLMPGINQTEGARNFGLGVGLQVRIE